MEPRPVLAATAPVGSVAFPYVYTDIVTYIDGRRVTSYNIQGSTVVRIDDVSVAFGQQIWDSVNRMVLASTDGTIPQPPPRPFVAFLENYSHFQECLQRYMRTRTITILGNTYANSLTNDNWSNAEPVWRDYNLDGQRTTLTATVGRIDGTGARTGSVTFIGDGVQLFSANVNADTIHPFDISVDVTGVRVLRIQISITDSFNRAANPPVALTNIMIR